MAETQSAHRMEMERKQIETLSRDSLLGILFAFILSGGSVVAAVLITMFVPNQAGAIGGSLLGITGMGSVIATLIKTTRSK